MDDKENEQQGWEKELEKAYKRLEAGDVDAIIDLVNLRENRAEKLIRELELDIDALAKDSPERQKRFEQIIQVIKEKDARIELLTDYLKTHEEIFNQYIGGPISNWLPYFTDVIKRDATALYKRTRGDMFTQMVDMYHLQDYLKIVIGARYQNKYDDWQVWDRIDTTLIAAWKSFTRFKGKTPPELYAWFYTIMKRACRQLDRKELKARGYRGPEYKDYEQKKIQVMGVDNWRLYILNKERGGSPADVAYDEVIDEIGVSDDQPLFETRTDVEIEWNHIADAADKENTERLKRFILDQSPSMPGVRNQKTKFTQKEHETMVFKIINGLSSKEIAERINAVLKPGEKKITPNTVDQRYNSAKNKLEKLLRIYKPNDLHQWFDSTRWKAKH